MAVPSVHRARVNGSLLGSYHGKPVSLIGAIVKADPGPALQIKSTDGVTINIRLKSNLTEPLEGYIEVNGIGQGKNLILADTFIHFNNSTGFDVGAWNEMIGLVSALDSNPYKI